MGYIIEITEDKLGTLAENAEKMLRYGGKVMQCIDDLHRGSGRMGERHYDDYRSMGCQNTSDTTVGTSTAVCASSPYHLCARTESASIRGGRKMSTSC